MRELELNDFIRYENPIGTTTYGIVELIDQFGAWIKPFNYQDDPSYLREGLLNVGSLKIKDTHLITSDEFKKATVS